jgi:nitrogen fixation protein NifB
MKIAICSSNGEKVDMHFGETASFYIYEVEGKRKSFVEKRFTSPYCETGPRAKNQQHAFNNDKIESIYNVIKDCNKMYTVAIGEKPGEELKQKGISVQLCNCNVDMIPTCDGNCK